MSNAKKPVAKARERPVKNKSVKTGPLDQALTFVAKKFVRAGGTKFLLKYMPSRRLRFRADL